MMSFRFKRRGLHATLTACAVTVGVLAGTTQVASAYVPCPTTASRVLVSLSWETRWPTESRVNPKGVTLCRGKNVGGTLVWLQMVDLGDGAKIRMHADRDPESPLPWWETGNPDTLYRKRLVDEWYSFIRSKEGVEEEPDYGYATPPPRRLFSVTNASFFTDADNEHQTTVPFPIHTLNGMDSFGVSWRRARVGETRSPPVFDADYEASKRIFYLGGPWLIRQTARVDPFPTYYEEEDFEEYWHIGGDPEVFDTEDYAVSFSQEVPVGVEKRRNYVGVYGDTVYIMVSQAGLTNREASSFMQEIQPGMEVIQMDGGGSAQFYSRYGEMVSNDIPWSREVPNVIAIYRSETNEP
jgi:hypothetical protein